MNYGISAAGAAMALIASPAAAQDASGIAKAFGAREGIQQISLSPDGRKVAIVVPNGARGSALMIADPVKGGAPVAILASSGNPDRLISCEWTTVTRLICNVFFSGEVAGKLIGSTRMVALNVDGSEQKIITASTTDRALYVARNGGGVIDRLGDDTGTVLMTRAFVPERTIGSLAASSAEGLGVERVDTRTLVRRVIERPKPDAVEYITDGHGKVRIMGRQPATTLGYDSSYVDYAYRKSDSDAWLPMGRLDFANGLTKGFNPYAVDRDLNVAYGFDRVDGRQALFKVSLDGSLTRTLVLSRPDVDVDGLLRIGRQDRVIGASYAGEYRETEIFDPPLKALSAALGKALPKKPIVTFVDASADESKLLLFAGGDTDPGTYYLFDKATRGLAEVLPARPALASIKLGRMTPVTFPAADGTKIPGYLTLPAGSDGKNLPAIVMPHGGPGARDEWGFDWWAQFFAARGFAVLQPNFRGSTGYGAEWFKDNGFKSWRTAIGDVDAAGRWMVAQGIAKADKLAIVGWSYGGYAALQSSVLDPALFKAVIAVAPVTDLETLRSESYGYTNYAIMDAYIGRGPHIREGSPAQNVAAIRAPVLMFHGDLDRNVNIRESRLMADKLRDAGKSVELVEFRGLDHPLEDSTARAKMLEKSDAFLRKALGM